MRGPWRPAKGRNIAYGEVISRIKLGEIWREAICTSFLFLGPVGELPTQAC